MLAPCFSCKKPYNTSDSQCLFCKKHNPLLAAVTSSSSASAAVSNGENWAEKRYARSQKAAKSVKAIFNGKRKRKKKAEKVSRAKALKASKAETAPSAISKSRAHSESDVELGDSDDGSDVASIEDSSSVTNHSVVGDGLKINKSPPIFDLEIEIPIGTHKNQRDLVIEFHSAQQSKLSSLSLTIESDVAKLSVPCYGDDTRNQASSSKIHQLRLDCKAEFGAVNSKRRFVKFDKYSVQGHVPLLVRHVCGSAQAEQDKVVAAIAPHFQFNVLFDGLFCRLDDVLNKSDVATFAPSFKLAVALADMIRQNLLPEHLFTTVPSSPILNADRILESLDNNPSAVEIQTRVKQHLSKFEDLSQALRNMHQQDNKSPLTLPDSTNDPDNKILSAKEKSLPVAVQWLLLYLKLNPSLPLVICSPQTKWVTRAQKLLQFGNFKLTEVDPRITVPKHVVVLTTRSLDSKSCELSISLLATGHFPLLLYHKSNPTGLMAALQTRIMTAVSTVAMTCFSLDDNGSEQAAGFADKYKADNVCPLYPDTDKHGGKLSDSEKLQKAYNVGLCAAFEQLKPVPEDEATNAKQIRLSYPGQRVQANKIWKTMRPKVIAYVNEYKQAQAAHMQAISAEDVDDGSADIMHECDGTEDLSQDISMHFFWYVLVPNRISLQTQTRNRVEEYYTPLQRNSVQKIQLPARQEDWNSDPFVKTILQAKPDQVILLIIDECHWGKGYKSVHQWFLYNEQLLKLRNVFLLCISATPHNSLVKVPVDGTSLQLEPGEFTADRIFIWDVNGQSSPNAASNKSLASSTSASSSQSPMQYFGIAQLQVTNTICDANFEACALSIVDEPRLVQLVLNSQLLAKKDKKKTKPVAQTGASSADKKSILDSINTRTLYDLALAYDYCISLIAVVQKRRDPSKSSWKRLAAACSPHTFNAMQDLVSAAYANLELTNKRLEFARKSLSEQIQQRNGRNESYSENELQIAITKSFKRYPLADAKKNPLLVIRVLTEATAIAFRDMVTEVRNKLGLKFVLPIMIDTSTRGLQVSKSLDQEYQYLKEILMPKGSSVSTNANADWSYDVLRGVPCILILVQKAQMGDTFPENFKYFDLRTRYRKGVQILTAFKQDVGRACGWGRSHADRPTIFALPGPEFKSKNPAARSSAAPMSQVMAAQTSANVAIDKMQNQASMLKYDDGFTHKYQADSSAIQSPIELIPNKRHYMRYLNRARWQTFERDENFLTEEETDEFAMPDEAWENIAPHGDVELTDNESESDAGNVLPYVSEVWNANAEYEDMIDDDIVVVDEFIDDDLQDDYIIASYNSACGSANQQFRVHEITGDGSCQWRSIIRATNRYVTLPSEQERIAIRKLKQRVINGLDTNLDQIRSHINLTETELEELKVDFRSENGQGNEVSLSLMASILRRPINIWKLASADVSLPEAIQIQRADNSRKISVTPLLHEAYGAAYHEAHAIHLLYEGRANLSNNSDVNLLTDSHGHYTLLQETEIETDPETSMKVDPHAKQVGDELDDDLNLDAPVKVLRTTDSETTNRKPRSKGARYRDTKFKRDMDFIAQNPKDFKMAMERRYLLIAEPQCGKTGCYLWLTKLFCESMDIRQLINLRK